MLKEQATILRKVAIVLDVIALFGAFMLAYYSCRTAGVVDQITNNAWILLFAIPFWFSLLKHYEFYESQRLLTYGNVVWSLVKVHAVGGFLLAAIIFLAAPGSYSRLLLAQFLLASFLLISVTKVSVKLFLSCIRRKGYNYRNILIVGAGQKAARICQLIDGHQEWGLNILGLVSLHDDEVPPAACPKVGSINDLVDICKERVVDEVVFASEKDDPRQLRTFFQELQDLGVTVRIILDFITLRSSKTRINLFNEEIPMVTHSSIDFSSDQILAKRCMDFVGALLGLALTALIFPFVALAIKLDSPGPIFFGQPRVRENGRRFICWKFRTMQVHAEAQKQKLMALNQMQGAMFKMENDPRVTRVGRFLRKFSLDEFPQFWNVLRGEMSLVGTRPPTPDEVATYQNWHRKRISIKPGITGLWQVSGRNKVRDFDEVVRLDLFYIETWTIWLDIRIMLKTPWVMLARQGAS